MRNPVKPNDAVHAGNRQLNILTRTMIAKEYQNERPIDGPKVPTFRVATAMFALSLYTVKLV